MAGGDGTDSIGAATASALWSMPMPSDRLGLQHFDAREAGRELPTLHRMGAMTVQRDRWERLESVIDVPYPRATVWRALTDPERLAKWFAISVGSLLKTDRDMVLDFED